MYWIPYYAPMVVVLDLQANETINIDYCELMYHHDHRIVALNLSKNALMDHWSSQFCV
jgi:hypothetical protein